MTPEQRIEKAMAALFPPDIRREDGFGFTDHSADGNLEAVIIDLEARGADKICLGTLHRVLKQLMAARAALSE